MTPPPEPNPAAGEAAFMAELRRLKAWTGLSYRELERAAAAAGEVLPYSTAATMLRRDRLPRETVLVAFVVACGLGAEDIRRWVAVRRDLAMGPVPAPASAPPVPAPAPAPPVPAPAPEPPVPVRRSRLRLALVGAAAAVAVLAGAGASGIGAVSVQEEQTVEGVGHP